MSTAVSVYRFTHSNKLEKKRKNKHNEPDAERDAPDRRRKAKKKVCLVD